MLDAAKRRLAIARAEYRHEWDYGTKETEETAYQRLLNADATVFAIEMIDRTWPRPDLKPGDLERLVQTRMGALKGNHRLPVKR